MPGLTPQNMFTTSIAATSLGAALGFHAAPSDFIGTEEDRSSSLIPKTRSTIGIAAATTAGILSGTWYAQARYKNPWITPIGMALAAGASYVTASTYKAYQSRSTWETPDHPSLATRLMEGAAGLGALYYGGRAVAPYLAKSVHRLDAEVRPWFSSFASTVEQTTLGNIGEFQSKFTENLKLSRDAYSNAQRNFPLNNYLGLLGNIQSQITNVSVQGTAQANAVRQLVQKYGIRDPLQEINGIRQATLADAVRMGQVAPFPQRGLRALDAAGVDYSRISLGKGVLFDLGANAIRNLSHYTPGSFFANVLMGAEKHFGIPFLGNPISFLRPREIMQAAGQKHAFQKFRPGEPLGPRLKAGREGAVFAAGKLYDLASGEEMTAGGILIKTGQYTDKERTHFKESPFGEILRKRYGAGMEKEAPAGFMSIGNSFVRQPGGGKWYQRMLDKLEMDVPFIHKTGFSEYPSVFERLSKPIKEATGIKGLLSEFSEAYKSLHEVTPELKPRFNDPARKGSFSAFQTDELGRGWAFVPHSDLPGAAAHWLANRPTRLMEELGFGNFDPRTTKNATDVIWKMIFKRFLPIYGGIKAVQLANDVSEGVIGVGPIDLAAAAAAHTITGLSGLRDWLGITDAANYLENLMPGSMTASGMVGLRAIGLPLIAGAKLGPAGLAYGAGISLFLGGTGDITKTHQQKVAEYYGEGRVPVRSGRWWETGLDPFEGSKIKYYVPNWYERLKSKYQYTDVQYGSAWEYWTNFFSPYHYAIKHYQDRPYPLATSGLEDVPFIGPAVAGVFAPPMLMHQDYLQNPRDLEGTGAQNLPYIQGPGGFMPGQGGIGPGAGGGGGIGPGGGMPDFVYRQPTQYGYFAGTAEQQAPYGVSPFLGGRAPQEAISPLSMKGIAGQEFYLTNEYLGMYGFLAHAAKQQLTGTQTLFGQPELESSSRIRSMERSYWEANIGGGLPFYETELLRRFVPHRRHDIDLYNPIPNQMPSWMPGSDYFTNFRIGDPYSKIDYGEIRLPGAGYERFHKPGAGVTEAAKQLGIYNLGVSNGYPNYSILDQYRILGDVAPYSAQFKYTQQYIMAMSKMGLLTPKGEEERKQIRKDISAQKKRYRFKPRKFTEGALQDRNVTVNEYLGRGKFTVEGRPDHIYQLAALKGITPEGEESIQEQIYSGAQLTVQTLRDKRYEEKSETVVPSTPVLLGGLNKTLINKGEAEYRKVGPGDLYAPLNRQVEYNPLERFVGSEWEKLSHLNIPYFSNKFLHERSALEEYERSNIYGSSSGDWSHPIRSFLEPMVERTMGAGLIGGTGGGAVLGWMLTRGKVAKVTGTGLGAVLGAGLAVYGKMQSGNGPYIPERVKQRWEIDQYFDTLEYLKYNRLYEYSRGLAIEEQGIDPEELIRSTEASKAARGALQKAINQKDSELALKLQETTGAEHQAVLEQRRRINEGTEFLHYQKYTEDEVLRLAQGGPLGAALKFRQMATSTMYGANLHGDFASLMRALPTRDREFFNAFLTAPEEERDRIEKEVPLGMRRMLQAKWGRAVSEQPSLPDYFKTHFLPGENWVGWHPAVNLDDVKYKVVEQTGLDMHDFNLWPSQGQNIRRKPFVPLIDPFSSTGNRHMIKQELSDILSANGYNNYELSIQDYAGDPNMSISMDVKYATQPDAQEYINKHFNDIVAPAYV